MELHTNPDPVTPPPAPSSGRTLPWKDWLLSLVALVSILALLALAALLVPLLRPATHSGEWQVQFPKRLIFTSPLAPQERTPVLAVEGEMRLPAMPETLELGGTVFTVVPVKPELGHWPMPATPLQAGWLYGTSVNYVLGLAYSEAQLSLLQGLGASDMLTLTLDNGMALRFGSPRMEQRQLDVALLEQHQPGLTLVLSGGPETSETRWVLQATYLPGVPLVMGQAQAVGETLITVTRAELVERKPDRWLVVEYQLAHQGQVPLDPTRLTLELEDGRGTRYQPEGGLGLEGFPAPLSAPVMPETSLKASASYRLDGEPMLPLSWIVRIRDEAGKSNVGRFALGYMPAQPVPAQAAVSVSQAWYEAERNAIRITGTVRNLGEQALGVNGMQIALKSAQGEATLRSFSPLLPWSLAGGEQEQFEVVFDRPADVTEVTFEMLGFVFRLSGLP